ncbi:MAG TPA: DNRLRE domain-containing protein [Candidatus Binatia bacterium]|nr:DNRLRE domain-containing protein [Candidatus Binatia bacterium]
MIRFLWFNLLSLVGAHAATIYLRPVADTALLEAFPTNNFGGQRWFNAGTTQTYLKNHGLIRFDVANGLPANARILSATLTVEVVGQPIDGYNIENFRLHRVLRDWAEGNNTGAPPRLGSPAETNECNWTHRFAFTSETWGAPGGSKGLDYTSDYSVDTYIYDMFASPYTFGPASAMTADLQQWLEHPEANFGWMLIAEHEEINFTARRFASREDPVFGPVLAIDFVVQPTLTIQISNANITLQFMAEADQAYAIEHCDGLTCNPWQVLTNFPAEATRGVRIATDISASPQRYYRTKGE